MALFVSRAAQYGLRALAYIAAAETGPLTVESIAADTGIPHAFLAKVVSSLVRGGILVASRGPGGGVRLARPAKEITALSVLRCVDGEDALASCAMGLEVCGEKNPCPMHERWKVIREQLFEALASVSVADTQGSGPSPE